MARRAKRDDEAERARMMAEITRDVAATASQTGSENLDPRVREVMARVPRHVFVPVDQRSAAYKNRPLAIGHEQTISQPFIVALMTDLLRLEPHHRVLEVGTGSGYQSAVLSRLARAVYTIEIVRPLGEAAAFVLSEFGYDNITLKIGDGHLGWPEHAPYDAIIVTAAPDHVPPALVEQLKPGGRLVLPVGGTKQDLVVIEKQHDGTTVSYETIPVRFVPLTRDLKR